MQSMLASVRKGKPVNEEEIPPPVALGGKPNATAESVPIKERELAEPTLIPSPTNQKPLREAAPTAPNTKLHLLTPPQKPAAAITPGTPAISPLTPSQPDAQHSGKHTLTSIEYSVVVSLTHHLNIVYIYCMLMLFKGYLLFFINRSSDHFKTLLFALVISGGEMYFTLNDQMYSLHN